MGIAAGRMFLHRDARDVVRGNARRGCHLEAWPSTRFGAWPSTRCNQSPLVRGHSDGRLVQLANGSCEWNRQPASAPQTRHGRDPETLTQSASADQECVAACIKASKARCMPPRTWGSCSMFEVAGHIFDAARGDLRLPAIRLEPKEDATAPSPGGVASSNPKLSEGSVSRLMLLVVARH